MPLPQEIIRRKRDGAELSEAEIAAFAVGLADGSWSEGQIAALAMAILLKGMTARERVALMLGLRDSGSVLQWPDAAGPVLDKHSTGGVGDNVSLILAPAVAAAGGVVPMISGRGLGHTGGTLDKLDSIPGYQSRPDLALLRRTVHAAGVAIVGQSAALAPADGRLYAIRDVTATVESIDLICASILSKKLAAGLQGLVLDVKTGAGAFMPGLEQSRALAAALGQTANQAGLPTAVLITDMSEPLAPAAGNAVEVAHAIDLLRGGAPYSRSMQVVVALGAELLHLGGLAATLEQAGQRMRQVFADGSAAERFARMVRCLGGPADLLERPHAHLPQAPAQVPVFAPAPGVVASVDTRAIGLAVVALGGGRSRPEDAVDPAVGFSQLAPVGSRLDQGQPLAMVHARDPEQAQRAADALRAAYRVVATAPGSMSAGPGPAATASAPSRPVIVDRMPASAFDSNSAHARRHEKGPAG